MAKTITEGFQKFLSKLEPLSTEQTKAKTHKGSVESCLKNSFQCYKFEETGSIGNGTGIRHYSDTDYFASMPVDKLSVNSGTTLREVKSALRYTFHSTSGIEVNSPAVQIPFGNYASENLEVTPCQFKGMITTSLGNYPLYMIPDGGGGWMQSSPKAHNKYVTTVDAKLRGKLKPLIQLIKAWKYMNDVPIISFYIELRITKLFENSIILYYDEAVVEVLNHLYDKDLAGIQDPMKVSGLIPSTKTPSQRESALSKLGTALSRAEKAVAARKKEKIDEAFEWWNKLFNENFPAR
jgi:hypothetical protein